MVFELLRLDMVFTLFVNAQSKSGFSTNQNISVFLKNVSLSIIRHIHIKAWKVDGYTEILYFCRRFIKNQNVTTF